MLFDSFDHAMLGKTRQCGNGIRFCDSCVSSLVSLAVYSPAQILLIVQTTAICHSFFFLPFFLFFTLFDIYVALASLNTFFFWWVSYDISVIFFLLSFNVCSILSLLIPVLHLDFVCALSVVLFLVSSLLYIYYSCSLWLFP